MPDLEIVSAFIVARNPVRCVVCIVVGIGAEEVGFGNAFVVCGCETAGLADARLANVPGCVACLTVSTVISVIQDALRHSA